MLGDFYADTVPKDVKFNLAFRDKLWRLGTESLSYRGSILDACKHDILFFCNSACWLFEPRETEGKDDEPSVIPMITWEHQDEPFLLMDKHLGKRDMKLVKSRAEGASWMALLVMLRRFIFKPFSSFGLVSMTEEMAHHKDNPDSLTWKLWWQLRMLPQWMVGIEGTDWERQISNKSIVNRRNQSSFTAFAATADVGSGGRKTAFLMDELAKFERGPDNEAMDSTQHVTNCRIVVSTPKGSDGAYYDFVHADNDAVRIELCWEHNVTKNRSLYRVRNGLPIAVDAKKYGPLPEEYEKIETWRRIKQRLQDKGFDLRDPSKLRSPWYDKACIRSRGPTSIAQELDRDFGGTVSKTFSAFLIRRLLDPKDGTARPPVCRGELIYDTERHQPKWIEREDGLWLLWFKPIVPADRDLHGTTTGGNPSLGDYCVGCDIATGTAGAYGSNSCIAVGNRKTGEKVAAYADPGITPDRFADLAIATCNWFRNEHGPAFLIWEDNGPGQQFHSRVMETPFRNFYKRTATSDKYSKGTKLPGFWSGVKTKPVLFGDYKSALEDGLYINRDKYALEECLEYNNDINGGCFHAKSRTKEDPSGAGEQHGDRVIADALVWRAIARDIIAQRDMTPDPGDNTPGIGERNSFRLRRKQWEARMRERKRDRVWSFN